MENININTYFEPVLIDKLFKAPKEFENKIRYCRGSHDYKTAYYYDEKHNYLCKVEIN